jgi:peptide/nickel transport system ATP-binding protein
MENRNLITIENLSIAFGKAPYRQLAVSQLNLSIKYGQCMGLVGESGSGKTLSALSIVQLLPVMARVSNRSRIIWQDENLLNFSEKRMRQVRGLRIGMIFQDAMSAFNPVLTIGQQMNEILRKKFNRIKERALGLLHEVGIDDPLHTYAAYPHQLSGGMRQRAMIAMALCGEPDMIIADEPTTALDVTLQAQILSLLNDLKKKRNLTVLFISHDLAVVSQLADEIAVLQYGKMVETDTRREFFLRPQQAYTKQLLAAMPSPEPRHTQSKQQTAILKIEDLKVYFPIRKGILKRKVGDVKAVDGVSFEIIAGKTCALVGESGSGKTTTALALVRLLKIHSGKIIFENRDIGHLSQHQFKPLRADIQMIFQDPYAALNPRMMIAESVMESLVTQKIIRRRRDQLKRVDELLEQVGLLPEHKWRYPHEFSGGERQRICIARALAVEPKLLILDEPTSALDVSIQLQILELLEQLQQQHQLSYLLITHNLGVVAYLSQTVAVMQHGKIVEQGQTEVLLKSPQHPYTQKLLASLPRIKIEDA